MANHADVMRCLMSCGLDEATAKAVINRLIAEGILKFTPDWDVRGIEW